MMMRVVDLMNMDTVARSESTSELFRKAFEYWMECDGDCMLALGQVKQDGEHKRFMTNEKLSIEMDDYIDRRYDLVLGG